MRRAILIQLLLACNILCVGALNVTHLRVNAVNNPVGIDDLPRFSWILESEERGVKQVSYCIRIKKDKVDGDIVYDSGFVDSDNTKNVEAVGFEIVPSSRYYWEVTVKDNKNNSATSTDPATFVTGLLDRGWSGAKWIKCTESVGMPRFRKSIMINKEVKQAWLYSSALGIYDLQINGQRVGHLTPEGEYIYDELKPGWTDYRKTLNYSIHDVTSYLHQELNIVGAIVTNGWWKGNISVGTYGRKPMAFIAKLLISYVDGTQDVIVTDETWNATTSGPLVMGDIWDGETYDATKEDSWTIIEDNPELWKPTELSSDFVGDIISLIGSEVYALYPFKKSVLSVTIYKGSNETGSDYGMINVIKEYNNQSSFTIHKGETAIIDFGQNIVGWTPFTVKGQRGSQLRIRYSEMLNDDGSSTRGNDGPGGSLYLANLRLAKATLLYTLKGDETPESYQPFSTYYGFRYCELIANEDVEIIDIFGLPISSQTEESGSITTSNRDINKLISNIQWGQRGNFMSIPTDCPQRNERYGWTGDSQVFCRTGMYNGATEAFYRKYLSDLRDSQKEDGSYPDMSPAVYDWYGNAGWADAGIIIPYTLYVMYGNTTIIQEQYDSMERYMGWLASKVDDGFQHAGAGVNYGDWLAFDKCDNRYVSVAYYAYDALLMSRMSSVLSMKDDDKYANDSKRYAQLYEDIKKEFNDRYWNPIPEENTQTTYILPLAFNLLDGEKQNKAKDLLQKAIKENRGLLSTGFLGTSLFLPALSKHGLSDDAYSILLQRDNPSWLYSIDQGATTIWERWDSYTLEKGFGPATMNSFNHYAYGAVGEWMYQYMGGIDSDESNPGFKHIILRPSPDLREEISEKQERVEKAEVSYMSCRGKICSSWEIAKDGHIDYKCSIPANTTATLYLPVVDTRVIVLEGESEAEKTEGVIFKGYESGFNIYDLESGNYYFHTGNPTVNIDVLQNNQGIYINKNIITIDQQDVNELSLYDLNGIQLKRVKKRQMELTDLNEGVYILKIISSGNNSRLIKVIKY